MKWQEVYKKQVNQIKKSLTSINSKKVEDFINTLASTEGLIFFTGVGKNSHVAAKTASTFSSMNIRSVFVDPVDALHGGMSVIKSEDVIVAISKSGCTIELYHFLRKLKENNDSAKIILVHSNPRATCKEFSYLDIEIAILNENDKFNIAPISSISVFTVFLQSVGVELSYRNGITMEEFLANHPGGSIGKMKA